jgi:hypothetical protein
MQVYCGIDWAEGHHDVALVDQHGVVVAKRRIGDDAAGFGQLMALLAEHGDSPAGLVPVAIETSRGLLVACLRGTGRSLIGIRWRARSPTTAMRWCWPTSSVPTLMRTGRCRPIPSWSRRSRCSPAPSPPARTG